MIWLPLALLTACFDAGKDLLSKRSLGQINVYLVAWAWPAMTTLCLLPTLLFTGVPTLGPGFWVAIAIGGSLNTLAFFLYIYGISRSDLSLSVPLANFTPLFLVLTSPIIVGESLTWLDAAGGGLIVVGAYVLNVRSRALGPWAPIQALWAEPGPKLILLVAFIWSITSPLDKVGVLNSAPLFWLICLHGFIAIALLPLLILRVPQPVKQLRQHFRQLLPIGVAQTLATSCQMWALQLTLVAHVIAIKRSSSVIAVLVGHLLFQEPGLRQRLGGAAIMVGGVVLILLDWGQFFP